LACGDGREPDKEGSKPSRFHKCNAVKSSRVTRRHLCQGIPFARTKNSTGLAPVQFLACGDGREPERVANGNDRVRNTKAQKNGRNAPVSFNDFFPALFLLIHPDNPRLLLDLYFVLKL